MKQQNEQLPTGKPLKSKLEGSNWDGDATLMLTIVWLAIGYLIEPDS